MSLLSFGSATAPCGVGEGRLARIWGGEGEQRRRWGWGSRACSGVQLTFRRETKRLTAPMIKQEETHKYRCKECNKLFKAPEFVMKHIVVKHGETVQARLDEVSCISESARGGADGL